MDGWLAKIGWLALMAILGCAGFLFYPDVACDRVFQGKFHFVSEDDRHRPLLQYLDRAGFGQAIGSELFALQRVNFVTKAGQANLLAGWDEGEGQARRVWVFRAHFRTRRRAGRC